MSIAPKNKEDKENNNLNINEEALILKKIYNIIEENNRNKSKEDNNKNILDPHNINNINLNLNKFNIIGANCPQKNPYKKKLQKILFRK